MSKKPPAPFIVLEGPDGSGKSTQAKLLAEKLIMEGRECLLVREPGGTAMGERVREILLDKAETDMDARSELFLFLACRAQLVAEVIRPALARGAVVLSDRFMLSTLVYQGVAGGLPLSELREAGRIATGGLVPNLTLVIDVPAKIGLSRRPGAQDRIEMKGLEFHSRVREGYLSLAKEEANAVVIDGTRPVAEVEKEVWGLAHGLLC